MKKRLLLWVVIVATVLALQTNWGIELVPPEIVDYLNENILWVRIGLGILFIYSIPWLIWGNRIIMPWKWFPSQYRVVEVHEIEVPIELQDKVRGIPQVKGKILDIKTHVVKKRVKK